MDQETKLLRGTGAAFCVYGDRMDDIEILAVAQAITDAHASKLGNDPSGRIDDAKTIIAAFDAIARHRAGASPASLLDDPQTSVSVVLPYPTVLPDLPAVAKKGKKA